jgi:hypothetical protein
VVEMTEGEKGKNWNPRQESKTYVSLDCNPRVSPIMMIMIITWIKIVMTKAKQKYSMRWSLSSYLGRLLGYSLRGNTYNGPLSFTIMFNPGTRN